MTATAPISDDIRARLDALDIDVSCALRFSRAALYALAAMSKEAREAIDRSLGEEAAIVRVDDISASAAIAATLNEARHHIAAAANDTSSTSREAKRWRAGDAERITEKSQYGQMAEQNGMWR